MVRDYHVILLTFRITIKQKGLDIAQIIRACCINSSKGRAKRLSCHGSRSNGRKNFWMFKYYFTTLELKVVTTEHVSFDTNFAQISKSFCISSVWSNQHSYREKIHLKLKYKCTYLLETFATFNERTCILLKTPGSGETTKDCWCVYFCLVKCTCI